MSPASPTLAPRLPAVAGWVLAPVLVLICAIVYVLWITRGVGAAAEAIVDAWKAGDYDAFFEAHAAPAFAAASNPTEMALVARLSGLADAELDWTGRGVEGPFGHASLDLVHGDRRVPMTLLLERMDGVWKLRGITVPAIAPALAADREALPALLQLASAHHIRTFALAAHAGSLVDLHADTSLLFQSRVPLDELETSFSDFLEPGNDIRPLVGRLPALDDVRLEQDDLIARSRGHYTIGAKRFDFDIAWVREDASLRPISLSVTVQSGDE